MWGYVQLKTAGHGQHDCSGKQADHPVQWLLRCAVVCLLVLYMRGGHCMTAWDDAACAAVLCSQSACGAVGICMGCSSTHGTVHCGDSAAAAGCSCLLHGCNVFGAARQCGSACRCAKSGRKRQHKAGSGKLAAACWCMPWRTLYCRAVTCTARPSIVLPGR